MLITLAHSSNKSAVPTRTSAENSTYQTSKKLVEQGCQTLQVTLHGDTKDVSASIECIDSKLTSGTNPDISVVSCTSSSIILYLDEFGGGTLCFNGSGSTDLTNYCLPAAQGGCLGNWNDALTSFTATSSGSIYSNIGDNGLMTNFSNGARVDYAGTRNNDIASSVKLN